VSRNPYEEEQWTGSKYIIKPANYKSFDAQNKFILYFWARNFAQCTRTLTLCPFGNETNLHILLSACISVERSAEHRFPSGLPAVGAAPRHFPVIVRNWRMQLGTWHLKVTSGFWDRIHALGYLHSFDQHNLRICGQKDGQTDRQMSVLWWYTLN
jgi:hypothetical protein